MGVVESRQLPAVGYCDAGREVSAVQLPDRLREGVLLRLRVVENPASALYALVPSAKRGQGRDGSSLVGVVATDILVSELGDCRLRHLGKQVGEADALRHAFTADILECSAICTKQSDRAAGVCDLGKAEHNAAIVFDGDGTVLIESRRLETSGHGAGDR